MQNEQIESTILRGRWYPTPEEFVCYLEREIVLCYEARKNISNLKQTQTLFSQKTWDKVTRLYFQG